MTQRSLAYKPDGTPCVAYGADRLYYSCYNSTSLTWATMVIDGNPRVGEYAALDFNSNFRPFITYYDAYNGRLKMAYYIGIGGNCGPSLDWQCDVVSNPAILAPDITAPEDVPNAASETPPDSSEPAATPQVLPESPEIPFEDQVQSMQRPWLASMDPNISLPAVGYGKFSSIYIDAINRIHITYYDEIEGSLRYAVWDGVTWYYYKPFDYRTDGRAGLWTSVAVDSDYAVHISFMSEKYDDLMYARRKGNGTWEACTVDSEARVGSFSSIALETNGRPHISYLDFSNHNLKHAWLPDPKRCNDAIGVSDWQSENVATNGMSGWYSSIAIDGDNRIHISYYEASGGSLYYVFGHAGSWQTPRVLTSDFNVGLFTSIAISPALGYPGIAYFDATRGSYLMKHKTSTNQWADATLIATYSHDVGLSTSLAVNAEGVPFISYLDTSAGTLKHARTYGNHWGRSTVDSWSGLFSSIDLAAPYRPHIAYYSTTNDDPDITDNDLRYARWNGQKWFYSTIDETYDVGKYVSLAISPAGVSHISYYDQTNYDLLYAFSNIGATAWVTRSLDMLNDVGMYTSMALDSTGRPHISYYDETNGALKHAFVAPITDAWAIEFVDNPTVNDVGGYTSIGVDRNNNPHISYYDFTDLNLKYAYKSGGVWNISVVDSTGDVGKFSSIALYNQAADPNNDTVNISYYDATNGSLKFASRTIASGWTIEVVDDLGDVGYYCSLALNGVGAPGISYYDNTNGDLKFAHNFTYPNAWYYLPLVLKP